MAGAVTFRLYTANSSTGALEFPSDYDIDSNINFASILTASVSYDWWTHAQEELGPNPLQLRVYIEVTDEGQVVFRGYVSNVDRQYPTVTITAKDKLGILGETLCRFDTGDGNVWNIFARFTGSEAVGSDASPVRLYPSAYAASTPPYNIWYPKYDSAAWYSTGGSLNITLASTFSSGDAEIDIGSSDDAAGAPPEGFCSITHGGNVNMIQYRGKDYNEATGTYRIYNCSHGRNGSTSTAGSIGEVLYFRFAKRIHFDRTPRIRGFVTSGSVYETLKPELYDTLVAEGGFGFKTDPLNQRRKTTGSSAVFDEIRAAYNVYAEEDATKQLLLSDVLTEVTSIHAAAFGPGIAFDIDIDPDIVLTRIECPRSRYLLDWIRDLLSDIGLLKGNSNDAIGIWYDAAANTVCIKSVAQLATTDAACLHYTGEKAIAASYDMENVYSAVACDYIDQSSGNYLSSRRGWHTPSPSNGGTPGGPAGGAEPYIFHLSNGTWQQSSYTGTDGSVTGLLLGYVYDTRVFTLLTAAGNGFPELIVDGSTDTGWAIGWDNEADATDTMIYFWFAGVDNVTPDSKWIGEVGLVLDMVGEGPTSSTGPRYEVFYFDDIVPQADSGPPLTSAEPTSSNGAQYLDNRLSIEYSGGTIAETNRVLQADNMMVYGKGIGIKIHTPLKFYPAVSAPPFTGTPYYGIKLKDIWVKGPRTASTIWALRDSYSDAETNRTTAPESYDKITGYLGVHKVGLLTIGGATRQAADYLAWLQEIQSLVKTATQVMDISSREGMQWSGFPTLAKTAVCTDVADPRAQTSGVVDSFRCGRKGGARYISGMRIVNFNAGIFGQGI